MHGGSFSALFSLCVPHNVEYMPWYLTLSAAVPLTFTEPQRQPRRRGRENESPVPRGRCHVVENAFGSSPNMLILTSPFAVPAVRPLPRSRPVIDSIASSGSWFLLKLRPWLCNERTLLLKSPGALTTYYTTHACNNVLCKYSFVIQRKSHRWRQGRN